MSRRGTLVGWLLGTRSLRPPTACLKNTRSVSSTDVLPFTEWAALPWAVLLGVIGNAPVRLVKLPAGLAVRILGVNAHHPARLQLGESAHPLGEGACRLHRAVLKHVHSAVSYETEELLYFKNRLDLAHAGHVTSWAQSLRSLAVRRRSSLM